MNSHIENIETTHRPTFRNDLHKGCDFLAGITLHGKKYDFYIDKGNFETSKIYARFGEADGDYKVDNLNAPDRDDIMLHGMMLYGISINEQFFVARFKHDLQDAITAELSTVKDSINNDIKDSNVVNIVMKATRIDVLELAASILAKTSSIKDLAAITAKLTMSMTVTKVLSMLG